MRLFKRKKPPVMLTDVIEVQKLDLLPDDTIVLLAPKLLSADQVRRLQTQIEEHFPQQRAMVLEGGMKFVVLHSEENRALAEAPDEWEDPGKTVDEKDYGSA